MRAPTNISLSEPVSFAGVKWSSVPNELGVYVIADEEKIVYVGMAGGNKKEGIRNRLRYHASGEGFGIWLALFRVQSLNDYRAAQAACKEYLTTHCTFQYKTTADAREARALEFKLKLELKLRSNHERGRDRAPAEGNSMPLRTHANFVESFDKLQQCVGWGVFGATTAHMVIVFALTPAAPWIQQFFRDRIGGNLGEGLSRVSIPIAAFPPFLLAFRWIDKRTKQLGLRCHGCGKLFNTHSLFTRVRDSGLCPKCGTQQFCDADQSQIVPRTGPTPQQSLQGALVCALLLLSFGTMFVFGWYWGLGIQWLAAGIFTILAGLWYLRRRSTFLNRQTESTIAEQAAEQEMPK